MCIYVYMYLFVGIQVCMYIRVFMCVCVLDNITHFNVLVSTQIDIPA